MSDDSQIVALRNDFYRDGFIKVITIMFTLFLAIGLLIALAIYIYLDKPKPINFALYNDWHVQKDVPLSDEYVSEPEVLQWVSDTFNTVFQFDFINYNDQLKGDQTYFTENGWGIFLNHLNTYANYNAIQTNRMFVASIPRGAPAIINKGLLSGRYAWWVQLPITIKYAGYAPLPTANLNLQVLVTRVATTNNLAGIGIDNVIINNPAIQSGNV